MEILFDGPCDGPLCVFAHGAGAPMDSEFMEKFAKGLGGLGIRVARFEFPYMQERRLNGKKRPPNRQPELIHSFEETLNHIDAPCVLIGKSMGGRMASIMASDFENTGSVNPRIMGVCALGYPFHPQGKPEKLRVDHLSDMVVPMTVVQGTRDPLGNQALVQGLFDESKIPLSLTTLWLEDGDHDLKPRKKSGFTHEQHVQEAIEYTASFIKFCFSQQQAS